MKSVLIAMLLSSNVAFARAEVPEDYSMKCWDHSFAYNKLEVKAGGQEVLFELSGMTLSGSQKLVAVEDKRFIDMRILVSMPQENCQIDAEDAKVIRCATAGTSEVVVRADRMAPGNGLEQTVQVQSADIAVRKIITVGNDGKFRSRYDVVMTGGQEEILIEHNLGNDGKRNCKLE